MIKFALQFEGKEFEFDRLPEGRFKAMLADLVDALSVRLKFAQCKVHHIDPTITLVFKDGRFSGLDHEVCCQEFAKTIMPLLKLDNLGINPDILRATIRVMNNRDLS